MARALHPLGFAATLLLGGCMNPSDAVMGVSRWLAKNEFAQLCDRRAGLEADARSEIGGVLSDRPNIGENLWLLFDFGLPFVEFERRPSTSGEALIREWGPLPSASRAIWRLEMRPTGDAACATFDAWLARVAAEDSESDAIPERWRERAAYGDACLAISFHASVTDADDPAARSYFLHTDIGRIARVNCHNVYETRYALVDRSGRRALTINALRLTDSRCHTGLSQQIATCGDPIANDLSRGETWFVDASTPNARAALAAEQER